MILHSTEAKIWWLAKADEIRPAKGVAVIDAIRKIMERFQFAAAPTNLPGASEGFKFQEGKLVFRESTIVIKELTIFNDGLSVDVYSSTEDARLVIDQVLMTCGELGLREPITPPFILLNSLLVVDFPTALNKLVADFDKLSKIIASNIDIARREDLRVIEFQMDPSLLPRELANLNPTAFRLERRVNTEYGQNRFFSFAHTDTEKHLNILRQIEDLISE